MRALPLSTALFTLFVPLASLADCAGSKAPPVVQLRVTQPLIAVPEGDVSTRVQVASDGCVTFSYPVYDRRAGTYRYRLSPSELKSLRDELRTSGVASLDPAALRGELQRRTQEKAATPGMRYGYYVSDEEVIELSVEGQPADMAKLGQPGLVWTGLRTQKLNHPEVRELDIIASVRDRLLKLGDDARVHKGEAE